MSTEAPKAYKDTGFALIAAGVVNIILGLMWTMGCLGSIYGACGCVVPLVGCAISLHAVYTGIQMQGGNRIPSAKMVAIVSGVHGLLLCFGIIPAVLALLAVSNLSKPEIVEWLAEEG